MAEFNKVAKKSDFTNGSMKGYSVSGKQILVSRVDDKYYSIDSICSHSYGYLPKGELEGTTVTCPVHKAQFDVVSGKVTKDVNPILKLSTGGKGASDLKSYETKVEGENIFVKV